MFHTTGIPELLAPAGGPDSLRAAVSNGADAVYLGLDRLNARRGAQNFTIDTLMEACDYAHLRDCRVYLTANVVLLPDEVAEAVQLVSDAWAAGVDAIIVQDLGLLRCIRASLPQVRIHSSTQMNVHSPASVRALADAGVSRVTLSRETSLDEIATLAAAASQVGVQVESFVHGALCICYSGQCLLSSLIGGRSANRGMCAQPCRLAYELVAESERVLETPGAHLLSPKDLAGISALPSLIETGVAALKIEGRMKSAEYVALVTGVYRAALDRAASAPDTYAVRAGEHSVLAEAFSRGFTSAYLTGERGSEMMSYRRPNNRGVPVGRIASVESGSRAVIALDTPVDSEDVIEVWTSRGRFAQPVGPLEYGGDSHASAPAGHRATIRTEEPVGRGDRVFRVRNAALTAAAERTFSAVAAGEIELAFSVRAVEGQPLAVEVKDGQGRRGRASGPVVERARTKQVTAEEITEHVGRLGGTPYAAAHWDIELSAGVGMGFSALHKVRRAALEEYERGVLAEWKRPAAARVRVPALPSPAHKAEGPTLAAAVSSLDAARACLDAGADLVHLPLELAGQLDDPRVVPVLSRVDHSDDIGPCDGDDVRRIVAGTLGTVRKAADAGCTVEAHWSLNALNAHSVAQLASFGASLVWLSPELSGRQVAEVAEVAPAPLGLAISGRQELMVTEHCILMAEGECAQRCDACKRRSEPRWLKDRKGYRFPVITDERGRSHVYNSVQLDLAHALPELFKSGVYALRADLETDSAEQAAAEVRRLKHAIEEAMAGRAPSKRTDVPTTSGHYFRGVS